MLRSLTDWLMPDLCFLTHYCLSCSDRARVVGGLPDVVAIQEGKVRSLYTLGTACQLPLKLVESGHINPPLNLAFLLVPEPDWKRLGRAHAWGVLDEEREGAGVRRALQTQVRAREIRQHHDRRRHHGGLWQIRPAGQEQVRHRGRRVHRQRLQPGGRGE